MINNVFFCDRAFPVTQDSPVEQYVTFSVATITIFSPNMGNLRECRPRAKSVRKKRRACGLRRFFQSCPTVYLSVRMRCYLLTSDLIKSSCRLVNSNSKQFFSHSIFSRRCEMKEKRALSSLDPGTCRLRMRFEVNWLTSDSANSAID